jgi:glucose-6-phosphate 1-dehydrogenase
MAKLDIKHSMPPTILTIFGATGDLSANYLLPALLDMDGQGLLPKDFKLVCVGRKDLTTEAYLDFIGKKSRKLKASSKERFLKKAIYFKGDFENPESFKPLVRLLADHQGKKKLCYNRLFYFATTPFLFSKLARLLRESGLLTACAEHERKNRVLVEKPFGFNRQSARALNRLLRKYFTEDQIYRIDHYLGKETVQNLMVARFANSIFEPLWNKNFIDHIQLNVLYDETVGGRQAFNEAGELKDVVQNHALQMLALLTMDEPKELTADYIRDAKLKVLRSLEPFDLKSVGSRLARAQYRGYAKELGSPSQTETFVALKVFINSNRWKDVPVYIRSGHGLKKKVTELSVHFKEPVRCLFRNCAPNVLTFRIQPNESVHLRQNNKIPGSGVELHQANLEFSFSAFEKKLPSAYERLLLDFIEGDQRLFIRSDEIEAAWKFVDSITGNWKNTPLRKYRPGSFGPKQAEEFIKRDGREWWTR